MTCVGHIRLLPKSRQVYDLIAQRAKNFMTQQLYNRYVPVQLLHAFSLLCKAGRILRLLIAQTGERRLNANRERHSFNACLCAELIQGKEEEEEEEEEEKEERTELLSLESDSGANLPSPPYQSTGRFST